MFKRTVWLLWLFVILFGASCSDPGRSEPAVTDLSLVAADIVYDTEHLEAIANRPVRLTLENSGALEHDFSVREIDVADVHTTAAASDDHDMSHVETEPDLHVAAPPGGSSVLEFTPTQAGEYEFYCTVPGHKEAGMVGALIVAP